MPLQSAVECAERASPIRIAPLSARSIGNKSFILTDLFTKESLDFMFLPETWQQQMDLFIRRRSAHLAAPSSDLHVFLDVVEDWLLGFSTDLHAS